MLPSLVPRRLLCGGICVNVNSIRSKCYAADRGKSSDAVREESPSTQPAGQALEEDREDRHKLSQKTEAKLKAMADIGDAAYEENVTILRSLALRGLRSFLVVIVGIGAFFIALNKRRAMIEAEKEDPTERYLREMSEIGFDVEQGEKDAAEVRRRQLAAARK